MSLRVELESSKIWGILVRLEGNLRTDNLHLRALKTVKEEGNLKPGLVAVCTYDAERERRKSAMDIREIDVTPPDAFELKPSAVTLAEYWGTGTTLRGRISVTAVYLSGKRSSRGHMHSYKLMIANYRAGCISLVPSLAVFAQLRIHPSLGGIGEDQCKHLRPRAAVDPRLRFHRREAEWGCGLRAESLNAAGVIRALGPFE
ncbi:hypothetical protein C8R46DRAFT_1031385 [Mycena filopes]|nr:hypothetical protein C8R46DRAFT_1031385 [Mycena filopes]